jgi:ferredoxin-NADP reductase
MQIKKYKSTIQHIDNPIQGVYTLTLKSATGKFKYEPGHFLHLAIDEYDPSMAWPESRCFSIQTSPAEELLKITYTANGQFTNRMATQLAVGQEVWLKMPYGELFEQEHARHNTVFISGGTGITPYLSLFTDARFADYTQPVLYAGFRSRSLNIYEAELQRAQSINPSLTVHPVYQDEQGILNIDSICQNSPAGSTFFISGPPVMIKNFKASLIASGIGADLVKTDEWE